MTFTKILAAGLLLAAANSAQAVTVTWASLTAQPDATTVTGTVGGVGLTYSGSINFSQLNNAGTDYWVDGGYTQGLVNRPVGTDLISLNGGGLKTITFAAPVTDVYLAFTSWNAVDVTFSAPFTVVSQGAGYWGGGTFSVNGPSDGFFGNGEVHGVLKFAGTFTSLSFTDTSENWHGFTVGVGAVPEPQSWAMLIAGFGLVGATMRRRRSVAA
jgi:hypothetical protein